jgi:hypothetical protein
MKKRISLVLLVGLIFTYSLAVGADVPFTKIIIDTNTINNPWAKAMGDLDGDGYMDMIVAPDSGSIVWYAYPDWKKQLFPRLWCYD